MSTQTLMQMKHGEIKMQVKMQGAEENRTWEGCRCLSGWMPGKGSFSFLVRDLNIYLIPMYICLRVCICTTRIQKFPKVRRVILIPGTWVSCHYELPSEIWQLNLCPVWALWTAEPSLYTLTRNCSIRLEWYIYICIPRFKEFLGN